MIPSTTQLYSHKFDCWIDCGYSVSSLNSHDSFTIHSNKDGSYYLLYLRRDYHLFVTGDSRSGVGPRATHLYYQKVYFGTYRSAVGFMISQSHCAASPMESSLRRYYSYNATYVFSFGLASGGGKDGVDPISAHLYSHKDDVWIDGGYFVSPLSRDCTSMIHYNK